MNPQYKLKQRGPYGPLNFVTTELQETDNGWHQPDREAIVEMTRVLIKEKLASLSANQLGVPIRAFVLNIDWPRVVINPEMEIIDYDEEEVLESCASFPRTDAIRHRSRHVVLTFKTLAGQPDVIDTESPWFPEEVSKALSYRIQHEMEHLNGVNVRLDPQMELADV